MEFKRGDGPVGFKKAFWVDASPNVSKTGKTLVGLCKFCHRYSAELRDNLCLDDKCIQGREALAIARGEIAKVITGVGDHGWGYTKDGIVRQGTQPAKKSRKQRKHEALLNDPEYADAYKRHLKNKANQMSSRRVYKSEPKKS